MARIFISYKRTDYDIVKPLIDEIEQKVGEKCWYDLDGVETSARFTSVICRAINASEIFLFMYSKSMENIDFEYDWTIKELDYARDKRKKIVLLKLDDTKLCDEFQMLFGRNNYIQIPNKISKAKFFNDLKQWLTQPIEPEEVEVNKISAPKEKQLTSSKKEDTLPPSLHLSYKNKTLWFYLAPDKKFYIGNIHAKKKDVSWLAFKFSAGELAALFGGGAALVLAPLWTIGAAVLWFLVSVLFSDDEEDKDKPADKPLCNSLSKATEYKFDLPTEKEKEAAVESARPYCIVLRVKDNPNLKKLIKTEYTL